METDINRLKVVLAEKKKTNKWLCEQLNVNPSTVSKWCTNSSQPDLETFMKIAKLLNVDMNDLVRFEALSSLSSPEAYKSESLSV
ncbi:helix-turn-helix transcriptional regulator [Bacteroides acidifaciens]|jgi:transcriptional regulator with XRE-family HTH domain|uniref:helix-turn-helix transcriptional regulator n=1 Tax=Bacteroides acidifaciens TaxID=85831 RepID=UPI0025A98B19|nr:helix-turn-helix transcriptional regulator [Bacteroides acidifaciens]